jgi:hypothetical protein
MDFSIIDHLMFVTVVIYCVTLQTDDSGLASYVAGQIDRSLNWNVS